MNRKGFTNLGIKLKRSWSPKKEAMRTSGSYEAFFGWMSQAKAEKVTIPQGTCEADQGERIHTTMNIRYSLMFCVSLTILWKSYLSITQQAAVLESCETWTPCLLISRIFILLIFPKHKYPEIRDWKSFCVLWGIFTDFTSDGFGMLTPFDKVNLSWFLSFVCAKLFLFTIY